MAIIPQTITKFLSCHEWPDVLMDYRERGISVVVNIMVKGYYFTFVVIACAAYKC